MGCFSKYWVGFGLTFWVVNCVWIVFLDSEMVLSRFSGFSDVHVDSLSLAFILGWRSKFWLDFGSNLWVWNLFWTEFLSFELVLGFLSGLSIDFALIFWNLSWFWVDFLSLIWFWVDFLCFGLILSWLSKMVLRRHFELWFDFGLTFWVLSWFRVDCLGSELILDRISRIWHGFGLVF